MPAGVASLLVGAFAACTSFTANDPAPGTLDEGGTDGATAAPDAAPGTDGATAAIDAALPPTPGDIDCFGTTCSIAMGASCCVEPDAGTKSCAASCPTATLAIRCDDKTDCAPGKFCCVGFFGDTDCMTTCSGTGERLCHADSECETGSTCVKVPCRGTVIGTCGPVGKYVKSFCKLPP